MSTYVFITIDTEEDQWGDYSANKYSVENIAQLPKFQRLFLKYGAIPTYLINYPVASNDKATRILYDIQSRGQCEIGTHCHPWNTPPLEEPISPKNSMMCNLDEALVHRKMKILHQTIKDRFGKSPVSFRAGRWGFGPLVAKSIQRLGYKIDTSISPFVDWTAEGGPDYGEASTREYRFGPDNLFRPERDGKLLEVPATIGFLQKDFKRCNRIMRWVTGHASKNLHIMGILDRLHLLNFRWLSPELNNGEGMIRLARSFIRTGHTFLNMSFHSTSMLPGLSPFVQTEEDMNRFMRDIEIFLKFACDHKMVFAPLSAAMKLRASAKIS